MKKLNTLVIMMFFSFCLSTIAMSAEENWKGIDDKVVGKIATEHGRPPKEPLINTGEGDMQLFFFLMAGVVGGFAAGYYWRVLMEGKKEKADCE